MAGKPVEILFSRPKKWSLASQIVKWALGTPFSHVCLKIESSFYEREMVYEASAGSVHAEKFENWEKKNEIWDRFAIVVPAERKKEIIQFSIDYLRYKYGFWSLIAIWLEDKFGLKVPFGADGNQKFICSEFTFLCLRDELTKMAEATGQPLDEIPDYIDPLEVYKVLSSYRGQSVNLIA